MRLLLAISLSACAAGTSHSETYAFKKAMARHLVATGAWQNAFKAVRDLHAEDPADAEVLVLRGMIYREQRLYREAEADLRHAVELDGDLSHARAALGILLDYMGRHEEARQQHKKAVELAPTDPSLFNNLGFSLFAAGDTREAIAVWHEALRLDPTSSRVRNNLGFAYASLGEMREATQHFELGGRPAMVKNNLGYAYQRRGNLAQAYDNYLEALRLEPDLAKARENLVHVATLLGRPVPPEALPSTGEVQP